jgi:predicted ribosome quality control (RQC) complex YloA/Tae2 family protein
MKEELNKYIKSLRNKTLNWNLGNKKILKLTKNASEGLSSRLEKLEDKISGLKDKIDIRECLISIY